MYLCKQSYFKSLFLVHVFAYLSLTYFSHFGGLRALRSKLCGGLRARKDIAKRKPSGKRERGKETARATVIVIIEEIDRPKQGLSLELIICTV